MKTFTLVPAAALIVGGWLFVAQQQVQADPSSVHTEPVAHAAYDAAQIDRAIAFHETRVATDPEGPLGWAMLAEAWLARSRESDLDTAAWEAEDAARNSLQLRARGNPRAQKALVESLLEQHRFQDALTTMREFSIRSPLYADALIEVGRYDDAERVLNEQPDTNDPAVLAVRSRLEAKGGRTTEAVTLLRRAQLVLDGNPGVPQTALAWFDVKMGDALLDAGNTTAARSHYQEGIRRSPNSYKAALGLARAALADGRWNDAEAMALRALETANSLDAKAILGDVAQVRGDKLGAAKWFTACHEMFLEEEATFGKLGKGGPLEVRPIDRQFATFSARQRLFQRDGLRAARRDALNRPDAQALDTMEQLTATPR